MRDLQYLIQEKIPSKSLKYNIEDIETLLVCRCGGEGKGREEGSLRGEGAGPAHPQQAPDGRLPRQERGGGDHPGCGGRVRAQEGGQVGPDLPHPLASDSD